MDYRVTIRMDQDTLEALVESGYSLYGFGAVHSTDAAGRPVVWLRTQEYASNTVLEWPRTYEAYTSRAAITPGTRVEAGFSTAIAPDQILSVRSRTGAGEVTLDPSSCMLILNETHLRFTCGISQKREGTFAPICALPLYGGGLQVIAALSRVLLMFSTVPLSPGMVVRASTGPGILIEMESSGERAVAFDINENWSWGEAPWAQPVPANSDLVPLLIQGSEALASVAAREPPKRASP